MGRDEPGPPTGIWATPSESVLVTVPAEQGRRSRAGGAGPAEKAGEVVRCPGVGVVPDRRGESE
jgi:hypothetical protein